MFRSMSVSALVVSMSFALTPILRSQEPTGLSQRPLLRAADSAAPAASQPTTRPVVRRERQRLGPPQPARLRLDVFTVAMSAQKGIDFSLDTLSSASAAGPKELLATLGKLGEADMKYRFDEQIDLAAETDLTCGQRMPVVQSMTVARGGVVVPGVSYEKVGCIIRVIGQWQDASGRKDAASVKLRFQIADTTRSAVEVSEKVQLPVFAEVSVERDLDVASGGPVLSAALAPQKSKEMKTVGYTACIVRLQLDRLDEGKCTQSVSQRSRRNACRRWTSRPEAGPTDRAVRPAGAARRWREAGRRREVSAARSRAVDGPW